MQRDVLKARREIIKHDAQLFQDRFGELREVRGQIEIIYMKWTRTRYREEIDLDSRPMITSEEWRTLQTQANSTLDWGYWNEVPSHEQWNVLANAGLIFQKNRLRG